MSAKEERALILEQLEALGDRFGGYSIDKRRSHPNPTGWLGPYKVSIVTMKGERSDYRMTEWGDTFEQAGLAIIERVRELDVQVKGSAADRDRRACTLHHLQLAIDFAKANDGAALFTECAKGHPQLEIAACDGTHCYRPCDENARGKCRDRFAREQLAGLGVTS